MIRTGLTQTEKLEALALKYYQQYQWSPKKGDYYTTSRNDLELYLIVNEDDDYFYTKYCNPNYGSDVSCWRKDEFLKDFGINRVYVADWILKEQ